MLVLVAPGQGAQVPGFLRPWLDVEGVADHLAWWSAVSGLDLVHYGTEADADTIRDTAIAQPLLVAAGLAATAALFPHPADAYRVVGAVAGHSVGEITAAAAGGAISAEIAMVFVRERGRGMAGAAAVTPTGMTALLGGDRDTVIAKLTEHGLTPANENGAGQIVAAGTLEQLDALKGDPPEGSRVRPLQVAGAFHTHHMAPAVDALDRLARGVPVQDPRTRYLSNADGTVVQDGKEIMRRLVAQVSSPVRWDQCMSTMGELGATAVIELPPAGTLTGLVKRALPGVATLALKTPDDLDKARELIAEHGAPSPLDASPSWRIVVAPMAGTITREPVAVGARLASGVPVATVASHRDSEQVFTTHGGTAIEWLVEDGDPVAPGQPLLRLHPDGEI